LDDRRAHAVLFLLLTCCRRTAEVILARWGEIDFSTGPFGDVWYVPGSRVKTGNRHGRTVDGAFIPFVGHTSGRVRRYQEESAPRDEQNRRSRRRRSRFEYKKFRFKSRYVRPSVTTTYRRAMLTLAPSHKWAARPPLIGSTSLAAKGNHR
jgi:hypothetical protein